VAWVLMPVPKVPKLDLRRQFGHLYRPSARRVGLVDVPDMLFIMIDGEVSPGEGPGDSTGFQQAVGSLYAVGYTMKFACRLQAQDPVDYRVMPLEGTWTAGQGEFQPSAPGPWRYTLMILHPDHITSQMLEKAVAEAAQRGCSHSRTPGC
jgi:hypothetical protein